VEGAAAWRRAEDFGGTSVMTSRDPALGWHWAEMMAATIALDLDERQLLVKIVTARDPALAAVVRKLDREPLSEKEREGLRSILADELCDRGLDDDDEPTSYGKALDGILGKLMFY
jgi:hypothetical protein